MNVYILTSPLFPGQTRKVILSFPLEIGLVEDMANKDNCYPRDKAWVVSAIY